MKVQSLATSLRITNESVKYEMPKGMTYLVLEMRLPCDSVPWTSKQHTAAKQQVDLIT